MNHKPIESSDDDQFWRNDRSRFVPRVTGMVEDSQRTGTPNLLVAVFGRWGEGKTSLLNLCRGQGQGEDAPVQWLDRFETWAFEDEGDLRRSLLWFLYQHAKVDEGSREILKSITKISTALSLVGLNVLGRLASLGNLGTETIAAMKAGDEVTKTGPDPFAAIQAAEAVKKEFQHLGKKLAQQAGDRPVVVPIDDIDRCRPERAIDFLFALKNLLHCDQIRYVVALDREAVTKYLGLVYGCQFDRDDANWFLEKIFDDWVDLPPPDLNALLDGLRVPESVRDHGDGTLLDKLRASGLVTFAGNARRFVRGCQRYERYLERFSGEESTPPIDRLLAAFGWCVLYGAYPEQYQALLATRGLGRNARGYETGIRICRVLGREKQVEGRGSRSTIEKKQKADLDALRSELPFVGREGEAKLTEADLARVLPGPMQACVGSSDSAVLRLLALTDLDVETLNEALLDVQPYM